MKNQPRFRYLRLITALAIILTGGLVLGPIGQLTVQADHDDPLSVPSGMVNAQTQITGGLDVVILIDDSNYLQDPAVGRSMFQATQRLAHYLGARSEFQAPGERHNLAVIRFDKVAEVVLPMTTLPLPSSGENSPERRLSADQSDPDVGTNFYRALQAAQTQLEIFEDQALGNRTQLIILLADDPANGAFQTSGNLQDLNYELGQMEQLLTRGLSNAHFDILGYKQRENPEYRWNNLFRPNWQPMLNRVNNGGWTNSQDEIVDLWQLVEPSTIEVELIQLVRSFLPPTGSVVEPGSIEIEPYQDFLGIYFSGFNPTDSAQLEYDGDDEDYRAEYNVISNGRGGLKALHVTNPAPGSWRITTSGSGFLLPNAIQYVTEDAGFAQEIRLDNAPVNRALINQPTQLVWWPVDYAETDVIQYNQRQYRLAVQATVRGGDAPYFVDLVYQEDGPADVRGRYVGYFWSALPGSYTITAEARWNDEVFATDARPSTLTLDPVELIITDIDPARQFQTWAFTAQFQSGIDKKSVPITFGHLPSNPGLLQPEFSYALTQADGTLREDHILNIGERDPANSSYRIQLNEPTALFYSENFTLELSATIQDFNGGPVTMPLVRAPNTSQITNSQITVEMQPDKGQPQASTLVPRLLDYVNFSYRPQDVTIAKLDQITNGALNLVVYVKEEGDSGMVWEIPMSPDGDLYTARFYPTRAIRHQATIRGTYDDNRSAPLTIIDLPLGQISPRPVQVDFDSSLTAVQFVPWALNFTVMDGDLPLQPDSPFESGVVIKPKIVLYKDDEIIDSLELQREGNGAEYAGTYTFVRTGDYDLDMQFTVPQDPHTVGVVPQEVELTLYQAMPGTEPSDDSEATDPGDESGATESSETAQVNADGTVITVNATSTNTQVRDVITAAEIAATSDNETPPIPQPAIEIPVLNEVHLEVELPDLTPSELTDKYAASLFAIITPATETASQRLKMQQVEGNNQFELTHMFNESGSYQIEFEVIGGGDYGAEPLLSRADIGAQAFTVRPVTVEFSPLNQTNVRQTDKLLFELVLREGGERYNAREMAHHPNITVDLIRVNDPADNNAAGIVQDTFYLDYDPTTNTYSRLTEDNLSSNQDGVGPYPTTGIYRFVVREEIEDEQAAQLPFDMTNSELTFNVVETLYLRVEPELLDKPATGMVPLLTGDEPLQANIWLYSVPKSATDQNQLLGGTLISPADAMPNLTEDEWFEITLLRNDEPVTDEYQLTQGKRQQTVNGNEIDYLHYEFTGLPHGDNYALRVSIKPDVNPASPYSMLASISQNTKSNPVNYQRHQLQYVFGGVFLALLVTASGYIGYRVRKYRRRYRPTSGFLSLADTAGRVFWTYDLNKIKTNQSTISGNETWGRALIGQIKVESDAAMVANNQLRVTVITEQGTSPVSGQLMNLGDTITIGDRWQLAMSERSPAMHTADIEIDMLEKMNR